MIQKHKHGCTPVYLQVTKKCLDEFKDFAEFASLIQPIDQGVLQAMKNRYKRKLLQKVICAQDVDQTQSIKDVVKASHTEVYFTCFATLGMKQAQNVKNLKSTLTTASQI